MKYLVAAWRWCPHPGKRFLGVEGVILCALALTSLTPPLTGQDSPTTQISIMEHYDLSSGSGIRVGLPRGLEEVSGLALSPDGRLFAHNDEQAILYQIQPETGGLEKSFAVGAGLPGDFEGLAIAGERFFLLTSVGHLLEFREGDPGSSVGYRTHPLGLMNACEMEGLAFDPVEKALLLPCKTPRARDLEDHLVVLTVPLDTMRPSREPRVLIPLEVLDKNGLGDDFHPSAIEIHPQTRSLLLLAGREEAMVEIGADGQLLATEEFKRRDHPQPEGIAFLPDGSLVLADEGQGRRGTLTRYFERETSDKGGSRRDRGP